MVERDAAAAPDALDAASAATLRAAAEVFVPGPPHDGTPGAADVSAELFIAHYLNYLIPGLADGAPQVLDQIARERFDGSAFAALPIRDRIAVFDAVEAHEVEELRALPRLLGALTVAAVYGEWTGQDADGTMIRTPLGWSQSGFPGPTRAHEGLLRPE